jgi:hypothetical protein
MSIVKPESFRLLGLGGRVERASGVCLFVAERGFGQQISQSEERARLIATQVSVERGVMKTIREAMIE